jgi:AcrR family transcriptional regulator
MIKMPPRSNASPDMQKGNKAKLAQERSHATRRKIIKSALQLWKSRGFDEGFDTTTMDEIADNAGVSRATVYYYFPKKEDILGEMAWVTAEEIYESALRSMMSRKSVDDVIDEIMVRLGTAVSRSPPAAVKRMLQLQRSERQSINRDIDSGGLTRSFSVVLAHAQEVGDLPKQISAMDVAETLSSICMGCLSRWSIMGNIDLVATLRRRAALLLAGVKSLASAAHLSKSGTDLVNLASRSKP